MFAVARAVRLALASVSVCLATLPAAAQTTWTVDPANPPGSDFTSIQAAVDAASPGDSILVLGASAQSGDVTMTKGIYLLGQGTQTMGLLTIDGIPSGQQVVVKGFQTIAGVDCTNSSGTIHFEQVTVDSGGGPFARTTGALIDRCVHVSALDSKFFGAVSTSIFPPFGPIGAGPGIDVRSSGMHLTRCIVGGAGFKDPNGQPRMGAFPGVQADASRLVFVDSTLRGGAYYGCLPFPFNPPPCGFSGAAGIATSDSCTVVTKGSAFVNQTAFPAPFNGPGFGLVGDAGTLVVYDPNTTFLASGPQLVAQGLDDLQTAGVPPGGVFSATLHASTAQPVPFAVWAALPGRPILHPISLWLDLAAPVQLFAGTVTGTRTDSAQIPSQFPVGLPVALQAVLLVNGQLEASTPVVLILY